MYGKAFQSMYSGSLFGSSALTFSVWGYVIAFQRLAKDGEMYVELNPLLLAPTFSVTVDQVVDVIEKLCAPDKISRSPGHDGRRLVPMAEVIPGPAQYLVVNGAHYRAMRDEEERREYLRVAKQRSRKKAKKLTVNKVNDVNHSQPRSTNSEAETDSEAEGGDDANPLPTPDLVWLNKQAASRGWMGSVFASDRTKQAASRVMTLAKETAAARGLPDWRPAFERVFTAWIAEKESRINLPNWPAKLAEDWHQCVLRVDSETP